MCWTLGREAPLSPVADFDKKRFSRPIRMNQVHPERMVDGNRPTVGKRRFGLQRILPDQSQRGSGFAAFARTEQGLHGLPIVSSGS